MIETRLLIAAATGALIGILVVVALSWTLRISTGHRRGEHEADEPRQGLRLSPLARIVIVLAITAVYVGIAYRRAPQPAATAPAATEQAALAPSDSTLQPGPVSLDVGGVTLAFTAPPGYCLYPTALMQSVIGHQATVNPDNVVHTVFGNCDELRNAYASQSRIRDFGMLMTPKAQLNQPIDKPALDRIVASSVDATSVKETLDQRLKQAQSQLTLQSFSSLGMLDRDASAAYFAYLFKSNKGEETISQACIMAMTTLKGRLVTYYLYSDYDKDARAALLGLLQKAKSGIGDFAAQNS